MARKRDIKGATKKVPHIRETPAAYNVAGTSALSVKPADSRTDADFCADELIRTADAFSQEATARLPRAARKSLGQFLTPSSVASLMASFLGPFDDDRIRLLDAGAGSGMLSASFVAHCLRMPAPPRVLEITAFEVDPILADYARRTLCACESACRRRAVTITSRVRQEDFIASSAPTWSGDLFASESAVYDAAIVNPPYVKIASRSHHCSTLRSAGIESSNLYTAFLALIARQLKVGGQLVAITPRSFCNGTYFRHFRHAWLMQMAFRHIHIFEARNKAFKSDGVLQENVIFAAIKRPAGNHDVVISVSEGPPPSPASRRVCSHREIVDPCDHECVIHLPAVDDDARIRACLSGLPDRLVTLGIGVSTGRVVDFRSREHLRQVPDPDTVPLIYPCHFDGRFVAWPKLTSRKPNAIRFENVTRDLLLPSGFYVLVRRFSAKEEHKRVVACVFDPVRVPCEFVAFENHLDVFHVAGRGLPRDIALGLATYLNGSLVDRFFRLFSGHTQVNASDLRRLPYPSRTQLARLGRLAGDKSMSQTEIDHAVEEGIMA